MKTFTTAAFLTALFALAQPWLSVRADQPQAPRPPQAPPVAAVQTPAPPQAPTAPVVVGSPKCVAQPPCRCGGRPDSPDCTCAEGECRCLVVVKTPPTVAAPYAWQQSKWPGQLDLMRDGNQVGGWDTERGEFRAVVNDQWGPATRTVTLPPVTAPPIQQAFQAPWVQQAAPACRS